MLETITFEITLWYPTLSFIGYWLAVGLVLSPITMFRIKQYTMGWDRKINTQYVVAQGMFLLLCIVMPLLYIKVMKVIIETYKNNKRLTS